jgi:hypothetical protein
MAEMYASDLKQVLRNCSLFYFLYDLHNKVFIPLFRWENRHFHDDTDNISVNKRNQQIMV